MWRLLKQGFRPPYTRLLKALLLLYIVWFYFFWIIGKDVWWGDSVVVGVLSIFLIIMIYLFARMRP